VSAANPLPEGATTLAEVFSDHGYATGAVVNTTFLDRKLGFAQGFDEFQLHPGRKDGPESIEIAISFLARHRDKPSFFLLHLFDIHAPYKPPPPFRAMFVDRRFEPSDDVEFLRQLACHDHLVNLMRAPSVAYLRAKYDAGVARLDQALGRLFRELERRGMYDDALIVVTSDHGESFFEHRVFVGHGLFLYEPELRVPLIVKLPARLQVAGMVVEEPVTLLDVMPTILEVVGIEVPPEAQGRSLFPLLQRAEGDGGLDSGADFEHFAISTNLGDTRCIRTRRWKYIEPMRMEVPTLLKNFFKPRSDVAASLEQRIVHGPQLYDLVGDPTETTNVIDLHPEVAGRLARRLAEQALENQALRRRLPLDATPTEVTLSEEERQELRALGYH
jgi:arylsulfatase A-like enzyme